MSLLIHDRKIDDIPTYPLQTYRNTPRWATLGPIDVRLIAGGILVLIANILVIPYMVMVLMFIAASALNTTPERVMRTVLGRYVSPAIAGRTIHATRISSMRSVRFVALLGLVGVMAAAPQTASAEFRIIESVPVDQNVQASGTRPVAYAQASAADPIVEGFATGLPLSLAIQQIVGDSYDVFYADPTLADTIVSWRGGDSLSNVLGRLAKSTGLTFELDQDRRALTVYSTGGRSGDLVVQTAVSADPRLAQPQSTRVFTLNPGETLSQALARWCDEEGYTLVWTVNYDYDIAVSAEYRGTLYDAVEDLVHSYERQGELRDADFAFSTANRVLTVQEVDRFLDVGTVPR